MMAGKKILIHGMQTKLDLDITLHEKEYNDIVNTKKLLFRINDMALELYPDCKSSVLF